MSGPTLPFEPFHSALTTLRAVRVPPGLSGEKRAAFVARVQAAVGQQAELARGCDALLGLTATVREEAGLLLIPHEPAAPLDPAAVLASGARLDLATLWWITWSLLRALAAVEPRRGIHGGLQLRSVFVDAVGRIKLSDFGLAPAIEAVCGMEVRRRVACCDAPGRLDAGQPLSGLWAVLGEDETLESGWIAPYFAPEILAGGTRLNPVSDQFSLGVMLYQLATGVHPLGAELSDPELIGYFVPEPYPLEDERPDWAEAFARQQREAAMRADRPILDWSALVYRLLGSEPGERFAGFAAAEQVARPHVPAAWPEALRALADALELLEQEQYDPFLTAVGPWCENDALPGPWRSRLAAAIAQVEQRKAGAAARRALETRLAQGYTALDGADLTQARAIAHEVAESADADQALRERAAELLQHCEERQRLILEQADALARAHLESAREALERGELAEARLILGGLRDDPVTSPARRAEAETLLTEIEQRAARHARQQAELEAGRNEFAQRRLEAALARLQVLLQAPDLLPSLRPEAETLSAQVAAAKRQQDEWLRLIADVEAALERGDLTAAEELLPLLPFDSDDPQIIERRAALTEACDRLRGVLERLRAAEEGLREGRPEQALQTARQLLAEALPDATRARVADLLARCQQVIAQLQQAQLDDALARLAAAEDALRAGEVEQTRRLLTMVIPFADQLAPADRARVAELDRLVRVHEEALRRVELAERRLAQRQFDEALAGLDGLDDQGLSPALAGRVASVRAQAAAACEEERQRRLQELRTWLAQVADHLTRGRIEQAERHLRERQVPPYAPDALRAEYERLHADTERGRRTLQTLAAAEAALRDGAPERAAQLVDGLTAAAADGAALPGWAGERIAGLRARSAELLAQRRQQAVREAQAALAAARQALDAADPVTAARHLVAAQPGAQLSAEVQQEHEELSRSLAELEAWLPRLAAVEAALAQGQLARACDDGTRLLSERSLPGAIERRLRAATSQARESIAARRAQLSAQLAALAAELEQRGRRAKAFRRRVERIASDEAAGDEQRAEAAGLVRRFEALPPARRAVLPIAAAVAVIAVLAVVASWYSLRRGAAPRAEAGGEPAAVQPSRPEVPAAEQEARRRIASALQRMQVACAQAAAQLPGGRAPRNWQLYFDPEDGFATRLLARSDAGEVIELATCPTAESLEQLQFTDAMRDRLFPVLAAATPPEGPPRGDQALEGEAPAEPQTGQTAVGPTAEAQPPWPAVLVARSLPAPDSQTLRSVFDALTRPGLADSLPLAPRPLAAVAAQLVIGEHDATGAFDLHLALHGDAGTVAARVVMQPVADGWQPDESNAAALGDMLDAALAAIAARLESLTVDVERHFQAGGMLAARQSLAQAEPLRPVFSLPRLAETAARLERALGRFPPPWHNPGGYEESAEQDARLGYPRSLARDGRTFLLVNVPPHDELWEQIGAADRAQPVLRGAAGGTLARLARGAPGERPWYVFYIEAAESPRPVELDALQPLRDELPTVDEWLLAALRLRGDAGARGLLGGLWDWCLRDGAPWVCGGCDALHGRFLPWPNDPAARADVSDLWRWLNSPLVSQPRARGDGMAGVRLLPRELRRSVGGEGAERFGD